MDSSELRPQDWLGRVVPVVVEHPRGSFVKRRPDGAVDVVSPLPLAWGYGHVPGVLGGDGDPLDAVVLGPSPPVGLAVRWPVWGVVDFIDAGLRDTKLVVGPRPSALDARAVAVFFAAYTLLKRGLLRARGGRGFTGLGPAGIQWWRG